MSEERGEELELRNTTILDRPWWPARAALLASLVAGLIAFGFRSTLLYVAGVSSLVIAALLASRKAPLAGAPHTRLHVSHGGVRSGAITIVERDEVIDGALWPKTAHGQLVQLRRKGLRPPVDIAVASLDDGRILLEKLGLAPPHAKATFRAASTSLIAGTRVNPAVVGAVFSVFVLGSALVVSQQFTRYGFVAFVSFLVALTSVFVAMQVASGSASVEVGADGVLVKSFGRRRMIRYADLDSFTTLDRGIRFHLRDGTHHDLVTDRKRTGFVCEAITERLRVAIGRAPIDVAMLEREGRSIGDWLAALRALSKRAEGFRDVPLDANRLWGVLEDPQTSPTAKAGAAVALARSLDDAGKTRLRVVSEASVSPKLRVALDAAATDDDDERLRAALEELEEERAAK